MYYKYIVFLLLINISGIISLHQIEKSELFSVFNQFPLNAIFNISAETKCGKAMQKLTEKLENNDLNALKMFDATAKIPAGILSGNVNQYGDFDECMQVPQAQYCLAEIDFKSVWKEPYCQYKNLVNSHYVFTNTIKDPAHRLPGFSLIRWGFCVPVECSPEDLINSINKNYNVESRILSGMCQKSEPIKKSASFGEKFTKLFFGFFITAVGFATVISYLKNNAIIPNNKFWLFDNNFKVVQFLMCFSLQRNLKTLFSVEDSRPEEIKGLHGIRSISAFGLLMSHKSVALFFNPYINLTYTIQRLMRPWTIIAKNAIVYTDAFMLISGLLNANHLFNDLTKTKSMNFRKKLINRLFRILPNLTALILFCTYILPTLGAGPQWPNIITHSDLCKKYMWRNFLFIHNLFNFQEMCLTHTHQLGIDMQLFLITPILVYLIWNFRKIGLSILFALAIFSTFLRFWVTYVNELSSVVYFGISIETMFKTANLSYILPTHRATIYLIGVYLAYYLNQTKPSLVTSRWKQILIWPGFLVPFFLAWLGPYHMAIPNFVYNKMESALIAAFCPVVFGLGVAFAINILNRHAHVYGICGEFFSFKFWKIGTKLSYAIYLVQFPVFFYNIGITKHSDEYHPYFQLQIFETTAIILLSLCLVLFIELPFQNIHKLIFSQNVRKNHSKKILEVPMRKAKFG